MIPINHDITGDKFILYDNNDKLFELIVSLNNEGLNLKREFLDIDSSIDFYEYSTEVSYILLYYILMILT
jgi:hypothetical protein